PHQARHQPAPEDLPAHPREPLTSANTRPRYTPSIQAAASPRTSNPTFTAYRTTSAAEPRQMGDRPRDRVNDHADHLAADPIDAPGVGPDPEGCFCRGRLVTCLVHLPPPVAWFCVVAFGPFGRPGRLPDITIGGPV